MPHVNPARPHEDPRCKCRDCAKWDRLSAEAPVIRCAETHTRRTVYPCQHGFTWQCPSFLVGARL